MSPPRTVGLAGLILFFFSAVSSQTQSPTPPPVDGTDVVKISTTLIQVDVTVKDKNGKVVTDLRPDEIEVYANGEKQKISNFSFISNSPPGQAPAADMPILPPTAIKPEKVRRTIALVVDDLTLSFESTAQVRRALTKFVDEQMQDGDLVAIVRTGAGIGALQSFTNDKRQLYAAIERVRWNAVGAGGIGAFAPIEEITPVEDDAPPRPDMRTAEAFHREVEEYRESFFSTGTLGAVNYVVRGMGDLPGRKSILLLSDGFRLFVQEHGIRTSSILKQRLFNLIDLANRASVVIYTMDARGLKYTGFTSQDDATGRTPRQIAQVGADRGFEMFDTQEGLDYLAKETGGLSIKNNNDLSGGIRKILDDQSYYLVAYQPSGELFDPSASRFNKLEIKVTRPNTELRYRSGFFGVVDHKLLNLSPVQTTEARMNYSLASPFAVNDIPLRLNALFYKPPSSTATFVRSLVHVSGKDLTFTDQPGGGKKATFDVLAVAFGDNGTIIDQLSKSYSVTVSKDNYDRAMDQGLVYEVTIPMKKAGAYQLRVALRDHGTDKIGSANQFIEVPDLKKNRLVLSGVMLENLPLDEWKR
ncbi:MAG TPA: VWA domain-containing protein, partial [Pyrinomonadaceae bacterium]|nr:VWA domain-containing protein [Pyrinomonadaceae bacterium]